MKKFSLFILALLAGIISQAQSLTVSASVITNVSCYGGSNGITTSSPSGGTAPYTYLWLPVGRTTQTVVTLTAATYTVRVTDHIGNTVSASATVTQPSTLGLSASAKYSAVCPGTSDSLFSTGSGGTIPYSYMWNGPIADISCQTCQNTNAYPYGAAYVVTAVNDANGCTASASVSITVHPFPYVTIEGPLSPVTTFSNDTLIALAPGASSYLWSNSATTSTIIVSPVVTTSYSVTTTNTYGCYDTAHYTVSPNTSGNGKTSGTAIVVSPSTNVTTTSYSSGDSVVWFSFTPTDSNNQIIANSAFLGMPVPHVHRLTLYNSSLQMIVDEPMPDIIGANQIRIDISHLHPGSTYYVCAARCPAHANMAGCNPSVAGECNPFQRWVFQMCFRTVPVFVPNDSGNEAPSVSQLYYEHRGQITDLNNIPRFDIKAYTNNAKPAVYCSDSAVSFVYQHTNPSKTFIDTFQRVDMVLTGTYLQPSQPVFKMQEDSGAGYLNYFLGHVPNGVTGVEGYSRLVYKNVYPNTDMQVFSNNDGVKLYFICSPGGGGLPAADPTDIELQFKGASSVSVTSNNGLKITTELGSFSFAPGFAYTDSAGIIKPKSWQPYFVAVNSNTVKFNIGAYNTAEPLIIRFDRGHKAVGSHPAIDNLDWSTYFGGVDAQGLFNDVCADAAGNVYAAGYTASAHFPVTISAVQGILGGDQSATVAKFSNSIDSDKRVWATYYGGGGFGGGAYGVALDPSGNVYITGYTQSTNLPPASNASSPHNYVQSSLITNVSPGSQNAFIAMFTNDGKQTHWTTYYGEGGEEQGQHIAIDGNANVYVIGWGVAPTINGYFPLQQSSHAGAYFDSTYGTSFILEFNASNPSTGITREWATRIGDSTRDLINHPPIPGTILYGCTVDAKNDFYITGFASGTGYTSPATLTLPWTFGGANAVVTKFNFNNNIDWSTYYGGSLVEKGYAITVDTGRNVYITGNSESDSSHGDIGIQTKKLGSGFFQRSNPTNGNGFIAEFSSGGSLKWGTYFGGTGNLAGQAIAIDNYNNLYVTGWDNASNMPMPTNPAGVYNQISFLPLNTSDNAFVTAFSAANTNPDYAWGTYFGNNLATGICLTHYSGHNWLYLVGTLGNGYTPLVFPKGSWQQDTFFFEANPFPQGTPFISQFDINLIIGPAGISQLKNENRELKVYPNPTMQDVIVEADLVQNQNVEFILYNMMGEMVYDKKVSEQAGTINQKIDLSLLPNGVYLLKVNEDTKYLTQKIIKQY